MSSRQLALSGVLSALAVVVLLTGGVIPAATFCAPILAMVVLLPVLEECGSKAAATAWAAVSLLALLLVPDRELALVYLGFGWYPLLRPHVMRLPVRWLRVLTRMTVCSAVVVLLYGLLMRFLGIPTDLPGGWLLNGALLVLANLVFLLLDRVLERMTLLWRRRVRSILFKK